jgi:hypothetical protein
MQFKDLSDETLQRLGARIIRNAQARIMRQVPQRGQNPFATNKLKNSLTFEWRKDTATGAWGLQVDYLPYGNYTNYGTRNYAGGWRAARDAGFFGREFQGYRPGRGGIRPQYWLSLRGDRPIYEAIVEAELRTTFQTFLNNTISGFSRGTGAGNI